MKIDEVVQRLVQERGRLDTARRRAGSGSLGESGSLDAKQTILKQSPQVHNLTFELNKLLGLLLNTKLQLSEQPFAAPSSTTSREACVRIAREQSPDVQVHNMRSKEPSPN
jgi:hypothetical protein